MVKSRRIARQFAAKEVSEGVGARVRRSVGAPGLPSLEPFLMLDEFSVALPAGFPDHPHRGFETVTYMLPTSIGHMRHEDFLGNKGDLRPGDLQWMTPGRGIVHAEMPATTDPAHGLQLWINLPKARKIMEPRYQEITREDVPHVFDANHKVEAIVFSGEVFGVKGPIQTEVPVTYVHFIMSKGSKFEYAIPEGNNAFVYTLTGSGTISDSAFTAYETLVLDQDGDGINVSSDEGVELIVITGKPLNEPVVHSDPFVMTTDEEIVQARLDYRLAQNGFENADTWTSSIKPEGVSSRRYVQD